MIGRLQSLRGLTIAFLSLFLIVTAAAGLGTFFATLSMIDYLVEHRIAAESHALAPIGDKLVLSDIRRRIAAMTSARETGDLGVLLTDRQARPLAGNARFARPLPLGFSSLGPHDRIQGLSAGRVLVRDVGDGYRLAIFAETEPIDDYFAVRRRIYITGFGAIVIVVLVGLLLFRRLIGQRIGQMRLTAESIVEGDLSRRVPLAGDGGEFDQQAAAFNHMLDRMQALMGEVRNISNDIAHELRTPLARLRNELSLIGQQEEAAPVRERLHLATEQADALLATFGALLRIANIESGARRAGFKPFAVDELVGDMIDMARPLAEEKQQHIVLARCDRVALSGDRQLLAQLLLNLLENAIRHTPQGTHVRVAVERHGGEIAIRIADNGPGIAAAQRALAMRRFGRLNRSRTGHGLGLPLADAIARLHHGSLTLEDAAPGLLIVVTLPL